MIDILSCEQGSDEWYRARLGIPTASEFSSVLAKGQGKTRRTYMMKLLGERITGETMDKYQNGHMDRGKEMEDAARRAYSFIHDAELTPVGFIKNGDKGCSPDSLIGTNGMVEIKTKLPHLQAEVLLADKLPSEHRAQVQGQLWVAEREFCDFVSYWPSMPPFIKRVHRDEDYIKEIASEVERFLEELAALETELRQKYGTVKEAA